jgi:hypothetical protein
MQFRGWKSIHRSPRKKYDRILAKYAVPLFPIARYLVEMHEERLGHLKRFTLT